MAVSIRDAMLVYRTLSGNGSVLAFCEAVFWRSAFATRCWFTAFSVVIGRSAFATPCWFTALSVVMGECWLSVRLFLTVSIRDAMWVPERIGLRAGAADLIGSCASGRLGREKVDFERFLAVEGYPGPPAPRRVLQQGPRGVRAKTLGFRVYTFTPPWEGPVRAPWWRQSPSFTWAP